MGASVDTSPLISFESKWASAHPEFGLALRFATPRERAAQSAFACLVYELEHVAFGIREAQPATIKLQWWAEELARTRRGEARHPLTRQLGEHAGFAAIASERWNEVIAGAFAQRDREPAADGATLLDNHAEFYWPLAAIEASVFDADAQATGAALVIARALRELVNLPQALQCGNLPLPLDVLAAFRLSRGDLSRASLARSDAIRHWLSRLSGELLAADRRVRLRWVGAQPEVALVAARSSAFRSAWSAVIAHRASLASRARDPLAVLTRASNRLSLTDVRVAWRAARRHSI